MNVSVRVSVSRNAWVAILLFIFKCLLKHIYPNGHIDNAKTNYHGSKRPEVIPMDVTMRNIYLDWLKCYSLSVIQYMYLMIKQTLASLLDGVILK